MEASALPEDIEQAVQRGRRIWNLSGQVKKHIDAIVNSKTIESSSEVERESTPDEDENRGVAMSSAQQDILQALCKIVTLEVLNLASNELTELPNSVSKLTSLQLLELAHNRLARIPTEIGALHVHTLLLQNNHLSEFSFDFPVGAPPITSTLHTLVLSDNQIAEFPKCLLDCTYLARLSLRFNKLSTLPEAWVGSPLAKCIEELDLSINNFTEFPACILDCAKLTILNISFNYLSYLADLSRLKSLRFLDASYNQLVEAPRVNEKSELVVRVHGNTKLPSELHAVLF